jgi:hypothetical protein
MSKIVIHLDGGLVQCVFKVADKKPLSVIVVDTDTDGDDEKLTIAKDARGKKINAYVHEVPLDELEEDCDIQKLLEQYFKDNK